LVDAAALVVGYGCALSLFMDYLREKKRKARYGEP